MKLQGKTLMIVAHPDDEIIFGYEALRYNFIHVICITNGNNEKRSKAFRESISKCGATGEIWNYIDEPVHGFDGLELVEMSETIKEIAVPFFNIITHNIEGEYGHTQHKQISEIVSSLAGDKNLYHFHKGPVLSFETLKRKIDLLDAVYEDEEEKGTFDWVHPRNSSNRMMDWIASSTIKKVN